MSIHLTFDFRGVMGEEYSETFLWMVNNADRLLTEDTTLGSLLHDLFEGLGKPISRKHLDTFRACIAMMWAKHLPTVEIEGRQRLMILNRIMMVLTLAYEPCGPAQGSKPPTRTPPPPLPQSDR